MNLNTKPLLPLRDIVIFPSMVVPLFVGREKSIKALQEVMKSDKSIVLVAQKNSEIDEPENKDIYGYGCLSKVLQLLKLPDGTVKVLVEGQKRVKILEISKKEDKFLNCDIQIIEEALDELEHPHILFMGYQNFCHGGDEFDNFILQLVKLHRFHIAMLHHFHKLD